MSDVIDLPARRRLESVRTSTRDQGGGRAMDDVAFATELVRRLNHLCEDTAAKSAVLALLESRVDVGRTLDQHPACHVSVGGVMGPLGMMNGLVGRATICAGYSPEPIVADNFCGFFLVADCKGTPHRPVQSPPEPSLAEDTDR